MIYAKYYHTFFKAEDGAVLKDNSIVKTKVSTLSSGMLNVVALSRFLQHTYQAMSLHVFFAAGSSLVASTGC